MFEQWKMKPLDGWSIVGMNHYHINGERRLFVAMSKDGYCITEEGADDQYLWNRLWAKATATSIDIDTLLQRLVETPAGERVRMKCGAADLRSVVIDALAMQQAK